MVKTKVKTDDGMTIYNVIPEDTHLWLMAGPDTDVDSIQIDDVDNLPDGFRWLTDEETEAIANGNQNDHLR